MQVCYMADLLASGACDKPVTMALAKYVLWHTAAHHASATRIGHQHHPDALQQALE